MISDKKLDQWVTAGVNVLIEGQHGVGKSERVIEAMKRNKKKFLYFSASTMDPFIDFIGVPRVVEDSIQNKRWLEFIKPLALQADDIEYLIFDEYNRAPKKVRNATMEILQFKSINGLKVPNLKAIWAMINPPDEEDTYDVEKMDAAQKDRFQVQVAFPNKPDTLFFEGKYGTAGKIACAWWAELPTAEIKKHTISPRRLAYALDAWKSGLDISDLLPNSVNIAHLKSELNAIGLYSRLEDFKKMSVDEIKEEIKTTNVRNFILQETKKQTLPVDFINAFSCEHLLHMLSESHNQDMANAFVTRMLKDEDFADKITSSAAKIKTTKGAGLGHLISKAYAIEREKIAKKEMLVKMATQFVPSAEYTKIEDVLQFFLDLKSSKIQATKLNEELKKIQKSLPIFLNVTEQLDILTASKSFKEEDKPEEILTQKNNKIKKKSTATSSATPTLLLPNDVWPTSLKTQEFGFDDPYFDFSEKWVK